MKTHRLLVVAAGLGVSCAAARASDWPQWRGPNRDAKVEGFEAPKTWPKELTQTWKVTVGDGVATPALVGDKLFVFSRQGEDEVIRCLDAATGKEVWLDKYPTQAATGPASGYAGPRSSPTVANGIVVTLGVRGILSCLDAASGKVVWRKDDFKGSWPSFFTSSSPIVVDGLCIAQLGGRNKGGIVAYDLTTGNEKWKWTGDGPAYASPALLTVDGAKLVIAPTESKVVAIGAADGKLVWETPFVPPNRSYNAASPIIDGPTIIYAGGGRGAIAVKVEKGGGGLVVKEQWANKEKSVQYNTPVLKNGFLYGLTQTHELFCMNARDGKVAWSAPAPATSAGGGGRGGRGTAGYGSIVDAGSVLLALTPSSELLVIEPTDKAFTELARIKVASTPTFAYPVIDGKRLFVKDRDSVTLWTIP